MTHEELSRRLVGRTITAADRQIDGSLTITIDDGSILELSVDMGHFDGPCVQAELNLDGDRRQEPLVALCIQGVPLRVDGVTLVPLMDGEAGKVPSLRALVLGISLIDRGICVSEHSMQVLREAAERHIGQPYSDWLDRLYIGGVQPPNISF